MIDLLCDAFSPRRAQHLVTNCVFGQEITAFVGRVLAAVVGAKASDVLAQLVLCSRLEALGSSEDVALVGKSFSAEHARVGIDECDNVTATSVRRYVDREYIGVHKLENAGSMQEMTCIARARLSAPLSSYPNPSCVSTWQATSAT